MILSFWLFLLNILTIELIEFDQVLHVQICWIDLGWDCYISILADLQHSYATWLLSKFNFHWIFWEQIDGILPGFAYALTLTRSRLELLHINFCEFTTQLWHLVSVYWHSGYSALKCGGLWWHTFVPWFHEQLHQGLNSQKSNIWKQLIFTVSSQNCKEINVVDFQLFLQGK